MKMMKKNQTSQKSGPYNVTIIYDPPQQAEEQSAGETLHENTGIAAEQMHPLSPWLQAALFGTVLILFTAGGAFPSFAAKKHTSSDVYVADIPAPKNPFEEALVEAEAAIVFDIAKKEVLYAKESEAQLPLASLAKLMTALIAEEMLSQDEVVVISKEAIQEDGDNGLLVGEEWKTKDLIGLTLLASSNDGAHALAVATEALKKATATSTESALSFVEMMNARAGELGLSQTFFLNPIGLDVHEHEGGAYGSAHDIATLMAYILAHKPSVFDATSYTEKTFISVRGIPHTLKNTNERVAGIPGLIASKTGFTDLAGGNLAVIFEAGPMYPIAIVVLGSSVEGRFKDVEQLMQATLAYLNLEYGI